MNVRTLVVVSATAVCVTTTNAQWSLSPSHAFVEVPGPQCTPSSTWLNDTGIKCDNTKGVTGLKSAAACCAACAADNAAAASDSALFVHGVGSVPAGAVGSHNAVGCFAWTFNAQDAESPTCYLKYGTGCYNHTVPNATSGVLGPAPPPPPPSPAPHPTPIGAKNVLFIAVDDMRTNIGAYNYSLAHTPNMDALAASGLVFDRAYVQYAYCSPSRNSFMTGRRPDTTRVWEFIDHFREPGVGADWVSMPEFFKNQGYLTLGGGKLFHPANNDSNVGMADNDWPASWSPNYDYFDNQPPNDPHTCSNAGDESQTWCMANVAKEDSKLSDQKIRDNCLSHLRLAANLTAKKGGHFSNFFVGCGFHKPHVPWVVPEEFFDLLPGPPLEE